MNVFDNIFIVKSAYWQLYLYHYYYETDCEQLSSAFRQLCVVSQLLKGTVSPV
jgi:hypothetical protein